jgi:hypothetical protein
LPAEREHLEQKPLLKRAKAKLTERRTINYIFKHDSLKKKVMINGELLYPTLIVSQGKYEF